MRLTKNIANVVMVSEISREEILFYFLFVNHPFLNNNFSNPMFTNPIMLVNDFKNNYLKGFGSENVINGVL